MASRQAQLCAAIVHASSLFLGHPKAPCLEDNGGDTVYGVCGSCLGLPHCTRQRLWGQGCCCSSSRGATLVGPLALLSAAVAFAPASCPSTFVFRKFFLLLFLLLLPLTFFYRVLLGKVLPACPRSQAGAQSEQRQVWKPLGQQVTSNNVLVVPGLHCILFPLHWPGILRDRTLRRAIEVAPMLGCLHGLMEVCGEDGPVGAIREEVGDIGREFHSGQCVVVLVFVTAVMT